MLYFSNKTIKIFQIHFSLFYIFSYIPLLLILSSCSIKGSNKQYIEVIPKNNIRPILESFVNENDRNDSVYAVIIEKNKLNQYFLRILAGDRHSLSKFQAITKVSIKDVTFNIYSGIELFFDMSECTNHNLTPDNFKSARLPSSPRSKTKNLFFISDDDKGNLEISKHNDRKIVDFTTWIR